MRKRPADHTPRAFENVRGTATCNRQDPSTRSGRHLYGRLSRRPRGGQNFGGSRPRHRRGQRRVCPPDLVSCAAGNGERRAAGGDFIGWWLAVLLVVAPRMPACQPAAVLCGSGRDPIVMHMPFAGGVPRARSARPRGAVVTAAGPQMRAILHELALPTFHRFARRWGYAVLAEDLSTDGAGADPSAQQAKWAKIRLLREALANFPLALWLDADILLTRDDEDIALHLHPDHFQALVMEHVPYEHRVNPNTGVWLMRSCPAAFTFLDAVKTAGPQPGPWADQGWPRSIGIAATSGTTGHARVPATSSSPARAGSLPAGISPISMGAPTRTCSTAAPSPTPTGQSSAIRMPCTSWACHRPRATDTWSRLRRLSQSSTSPRQSLANARPAAGSPGLHRAHRLRWPRSRDRPVADPEKLAGIALDGVAGTRVVPPIAPDLERPSLDQSLARTTSTVVTALGDDEIWSVDDLADFLRIPRNSIFKDDWSG